MSFQVTAAFQNDLKASNHYSGPIDGDFGPMTLQAAIEVFSPPIIPPWVSIAQKDLGLSEIKGKLHNPRIVKAHKVAGLPEEYWNDETAWCGSILGLWMKESGTTPPKGSASAASWRTFGTKSKMLHFGDVLLFHREGGSGYHVCLCVGWHSYMGVDFVFHLGGNQSDKVCVQSKPKTSIAEIRKV